MQINVKKYSKYKKIALTTLLVPALSLSQTSALANETQQHTQNQVNDVSDSAGAKVASQHGEQSEAKRQLMNKLSTLTFFSANFTQTILSEQGETLQQGTGNFSISKPNLAYWQTLTPDETLIVSDGNTLWFYDPFIEQTTAFSLAKSIHNTPILLLTSDEPQLWSQYNVTQSHTTQSNGSGKLSHFVVIPKNPNGQIKKLTLSFLPTAEQEKAVLKSFSFQDATGQISQINLTNFNSTTKPVDSLFTFSLPEGVRLEDKR